MYYFYVLQSQKNRNWFYKGSTNDLRRRLTQHNNGENLSTKPYRPLKIVYYEAYETSEAAIKRERGVKKSGSVWISLMKRINESLR